MYTNTFAESSFLQMSMLLDVFTNSFIFKIVIKHEDLGWHDFSWQYAIIPSVSDPEIPQTLTCQNTYCEYICGLFLIIIFYQAHFKANFPWGPEKRHTGNLFWCKMLPALKKPCIRIFMQVTYRPKSYRKDEFLRMCFAAGWVRATAASSSSLASAPELRLQVPLQARRWTKSERKKGKTSPILRCFPRPLSASSECMGGAPSFAQIWHLLDNSLSPLNTVAASQREKAKWGREWWISLFDVWAGMKNGRGIFFFAPSRSFSACVVHALDKGNRDEGCTDCKMSLLEEKVCLVWGPSVPFAHLLLSFLSFTAAIYDWLSDVMHHGQVCLRLRLCVCIF